MWVMYKISLTIPAKAVWTALCLVVDNVVLRRFAQNQNEFVLYELKTGDLRPGHQN